MSSAFPDSPLTDEEPPSHAEPGAETDHSGGDAPPADESVPGANESVRDESVRDESVRDESARRRFYDHAPGIDSEDKILYGVVGLIMLLLFGFFSVLTFRVIPPEDAPGAATLQDRVLVPGDPSLSFLASQLHLSELRYTHAAQSVFAITARSNAAFLVGSLMALLGGLIIVRRVRDTNTNLDLGAGTIFDVQIASSSPGIILASLGMIVIVASLLTDTHIGVNDDGVEAPPGVPRSAALNLSSNVGSNPKINTDSLKEQIQDRLDAAGTPSSNPNE